MQFKQTEVLNNVFGRAQAFAKRQGYAQPTLDHLFWAILDQDHSHAMHLLRRWLKDWELYQIKTRLGREMERMGRLIGEDRSTQTVTVEVDLQLRMAAELGATAPLMLHTGHLLVAILRDRRAFSSRVLALYHITACSIRDAMADLPPDEDYYEDIRALGTQTRSSTLSGEVSYALSDEEPVSSELLRKARSGPNGNRTGELSLDRFGTDLTQAARDGKLDPVIGRQGEIERMIQILGRRKKNNPVLIGEPGVGKSALVEGLALRIAQAQVPEFLLRKRVFSLDISALVAGTKYRGEFEERLNLLLQTLDRHSDVVLFIDELHTIVGAGSTQGALDTANILKPVLARGGFQCIGATTLAEYREYIESDGALERRFQKIIVDPPSASETLEVLRHIKPFYEKHHGVRYAEEALRACVELTERHMSERFFPDKAIDVLDEAGSWARLRTYSEMFPGTDSFSGTSSGTSRGALESICIGRTQIEEVVASMTGIPSSRLSQGDQQRLQGLYEHFSAEVIGQDEAVRKVTRALQRSRVGLKDPDRPIGVFLFVGPTGVGKTHLAKQLADRFFDSEEALVRVDMSEYAEKHNVSRLIGSPPGYVGYGEGGQLTERVRRRPYCVLLFDEIEKAHPEVFNLMLQIFDEGHLTDGLGRRVDFRHTIIVMTSNVGSREVQRGRQVVGYGTSRAKTEVQANESRMYRKSLERVFAPEFINRIDHIVTFRALDEEDLRAIVDLELSRLARRLEGLGYGIQTSEKARRWLVETGHESRYGVRSLKRTILDQVEEPLAEMIVEGRVKDGDVIDVGCRNDALFLRVKQSA